ncbi:Histone chaperone domain CHZ [Moelleriella libera RCEF 2490]|uniref:Histone chaperone domain CHZ n=1 Tax=Moelleriella libera RCEF 2490 TaxID=1081109 RepID=A0A162ICG8_9HYPO|nr:Histone chaperone domain CHZ [Moelleriella libera RCEF 2490]
MAENGATLSQSPSAEEVSSVESKGKGKGKAAAEEAPTREVTATEGGDDDDEDDEDDEEDEDDDENGGDEEDGMEEIDLNNVVEGGRRTRGAKIDFAKAAEENPADEDEDEDDDDFQPPPEDTEMSG